MASHLQPRLGVVFLVVLLGCNNIGPLDKATADSLLRDIDGSRDLYCRTDVMAPSGVVGHHWDNPHAGSVSECMHALERKGLTSVQCNGPADIDDATSNWLVPCQGITVTLDENRTMVENGRLLVLCGTATQYTKSIQTAGDVSWISFHTMFEVSPGMIDGLESCRLVPSVLPQDGTRIARWQRGRWHLEAERDQVAQVRH